MEQKLITSYCNRSNEYSIRIARNILQVGTGLRSTFRLNYSSLVNAIESVRCDGLFPKRNVYIYAWMDGFRENAHIWVLFNPNTQRRRDRRENNNHTHARRKNEERNETKYISAFGWNALFALSPFPSLYVSVSSLWFLRFAVNMYHSLCSMFIFM